MRIFLCIVVVIICNGQIFSQYRIRDSCGAFTLHIKAGNLQSDTIQLAYQDCDNLNEKKGLIVLSHGQATIHGRINRATEGILFTNIKSILRDGPRVIRFIIEPTEMTLHFDMVHDSAQNIKIVGSYSEKQKENWETQNELFLPAKDVNLNNLVQLNHHKGSMDSTEFNKKFDALGNQYDSLYEVINSKALKYVKANPNSYFSGYLLYVYRIKIATDTLAKYYSYLDPAVMHSDFGKNTLKALFSLTSDSTVIREFSDSVNYKEFRAIKTIYDIAAENLEGTKTSLSQFKGNVLLVDFWARWCGICIKNIPYLKKLIAEMKNRPLKVISVSIDDNPVIWKKAIKKNSFPGVDLYDSNGLLSTYFKVLWVPRYIIIDSDGTVANKDAPQASDPELKIILNNLLNRKN